MACNFSTEFMSSLCHQTTSLLSRDPCSKWHSPRSMTPGPVTVINTLTYVLRPSFYMACNFINKSRSCLCHQTTSLLSRDSRPNEMQLHQWVYIWSPPSNSLSSVLRPSFYMACNFIKESSSCLCHQTTSLLSRDPCSKWHASSSMSLGPVRAIKHFRLRFETLI